MLSAAAAISSCYVKITDGWHCYTQYLRFNSSKYSALDLPKDEFMGLSSWVLITGCMLSWGAVKKIGMQWMNGLNRNDKVIYNLYG
jgi:hypothetical protein